MRIEISEGSFEGVIANTLVTEKADTIPLNVMKKHLVS